jgi:hypothetical protein
MSNSIDLKSGSGDNHMASLSFHWNCILKDGTHIFQFDKNGTEHKFKEVLDRMNDLVYFNLTNNNGKLFSVNLTNGLIGYNDLIFPYRESETKKENIRLIYFRRNKIELTESLEKKSHTITYHLGYQYLDKGINRQVVLEINSEGNWILGA